MGAWGLGAFENDGAFESFCRVRDGKIDAIAQAFASALAQADYLEVDAGQNAVAAAEMVATAYDRPDRKLPDDIRDIIAAQAARIRDVPELIGQARASLARVLTDGSEIAELWDEVGESAEWRERVTDLDRRLNDIKGA
ncbi:hypothetical protein NS228_06875 [Methylobacterium indicum]|jgi:hypothetical protein|uniref:DUF4259 domain-containing protein n=3 Tax=Methylobacterium TaxID=407 RepID=A0ABR5HI20_9HYPH|nr:MULTISPECIES: DUF4259 domain-containing protein [Methylobacterium]KMO23916.1 hypothetical protein QR78_02730 [Methylobacterium indicum]KMO26342.1 hypothetical protein QR79_03105 [Methylobacterium indicum]KTS36926.1 hypothetical protein NS229_08740 [Methylobacterium indicum]KTS41410.1 hypothetical protein NS228_06875 [Methylobacterium indicum]KTS52064.1 hypothetical protein NS230_11720 [Methylobacterium indicum]